MQTINQSSVPNIAPHVRPVRWLLAIVMAGLAACSNVPERSQAEIDNAKRIRFEDTPAGARAVLDESILFEFGKAEFSGSADPVLDALKPAFAKARGQIVVEGHTDTVGSVAFNNSLSTRRAERVREALVSRQVPPERVVARGLGSSKPRRSPESTDEDRRLNRRAEFLFIGETVASLGAGEVEKQAESRLTQLSKALSRTTNRVSDWFRQAGTAEEKK